MPRRGRPSQADLAAAELGPSGDMPVKWLMLVGDDPKELDDATWAYRRLMLWCSPARKTQWMGTVVEEQADVCDRIATTIAQDYGLKATLFDSKEEAERALSEHMSEGID